ncbi:MAG TPA: hypothetical protein VHB21_19090, partial [Minicystis sp.]|nr:hypothetical protein [Minicystis sp.]
MLERAFMLGFPAIAIALAALVFLGPGATRPAIGARVYGAPAPGGPVSVRVLASTSLFGVEEAVPVRDLAVRGEDGRVRWSGAAGDDGVAEAHWDERGAPRVDVEVTGRGRLLARGAL